MSSNTIYKTSELIKLYEDKQLNVDPIYVLDLYQGRYDERLKSNPNYRRPTTWTQSKKQNILYLMFYSGFTTIPGHEFILRELNSEPNYDALKQYELVNGKELLMTIVEFVSGQITIGSEAFYKQDFVIIEAKRRLMFENTVLYNLSFAELPKQAQEWFLSLAFHSWVLRNDDDQLVRAKLISYHDFRE